MSAQATRQVQRFYCNACYLTSFFPKGPTRAVIRAVPIAVLKPMIGASEAISKTLFGLGGTLDPSTHQDTEVKYKHR